MQEEKRRRGMDERKFYAEAGRGGDPVEPPGEGVADRVSTLFENI